MKHTPGEWKVDKEGNGVYSPELDLHITNPMHPCFPDESEAQANAEFIVLACNTHDELLEACKKAKKYLEPDLIEPGRTVFWELVNAIAKAEGKEA